MGLGPELEGDRHAEGVGGLGDDYLYGEICNMDNCHMGSHSMNRQTDTTEKLNYLSWQVVIMQCFREDHDSQFNLNIDKKGDSGVCFTWKYLLLCTE